MELFRRVRHYNALKVRVKKRIELAIKSLWLMSYPLLITVIADIVWYYATYRRHVYFNERMEGVVTAAWIPTFGIAWAVLAGAFFNTVWSEYKSFRASVKRWDIVSFMELRDEEISPLAHVMMSTISLAVLGGFMSIKYPSVEEGLFLISTTSFVLALVYFVIDEIDDLCAGIWFIKAIPPKWLDIDPKKYLEEHTAKARKEFERKNKDGHNGWDHDAQE